MMLSAGWRTRLLFLVIASRSSAPSLSTMSSSIPSTSLGILEQHDVTLENMYDSSNAPDTKKLKIEQSASFSLKNEERESSCTSQSVPFSAIKCNPRKITSAQKLDFPLSAVKVCGWSVPATSEHSVSSSVLDSVMCVGGNSEREYEQEQDTENSCTSMEIEPQIVQDKDKSCNNDLDPTRTAKEKEDKQSDHSDMETENEEQTEVRLGDKDDKETSCDSWEQLPFFGMEDVDSCSQESATKVDKASEEENVKEKDKRKRRRCGKKVAKVSEDKPKRLPPNAFVAVRIPSSDIRDKFEEVQAALLAKDKRVGAVFVPAAKNHLTLMVMRLDHRAPEEIEKAKLTLREAAEKVTRDLDLINDPIELKFSGLGNFSKSVLYAKIAEDRNRERLVAMAEMVKSIFVAKAISSADNNSKDFVPHLTIAKMSKTAGRKLKWKNKKKHKKKKSDNDKDFLRGIEPSSYAELLDVEFGSQVIDGLELLSMIEPPGEDGYYHYFDKCSFNTVRLEKGTPMVKCD